jgi:hypothetical protein
MQRNLSRERAIAKSLGPLTVWQPRAARPYSRRADARAAAAYIRQQEKIQRELDGAADLLLKAKEFSESS